MIENLNSSAPLLKKLDKAVFEQVDKFKLTPNYTALQDFYNGLDEEQQKLFKAALNLVLVLLPLLFLGFLFWQNLNLHKEYELRKGMLEKAQTIIGQKQSLQNAGPRILSMNPIDSDSMMTSRLSNTLSQGGIDTSKVRISNFSSTSISETVFRSEADIGFSGFTTIQLMNAFTTLVQRERFRISSVDISRNAETNLLNGQFHAIHFSLVSPQEDE